MSKALRIALIGAGQIGSKRLAGYAQFPAQLSLAAICDLDPRAAGRLAGQAGLERVYTDPERLLKEAAIDAVDVCTPHAGHAPLAIAAAEAGKHVLVEKPMACTLPDCHAMVAAAEKAGVVLMVAQNQRYKPAHRAIRRILDEGELGEIHALRADAMLNVLAGAPPEHWVYDGARSGGGVVISFALHRLDLARYFLGEIRRVTAVCRTMHPRFIHGAEDHAAVVLEFENGAMGHLFASFVPYRPPWGEMLMLLGQSGTLYAIPPNSRSDDPPLICSAQRDPAAFVPLTGAGCDLPSADMFVNQLLHFADCCRTGAEPLSSGRDNLQTMKAVFGVYQSARTGRAVDAAEM